MSLQDFVFIMMCGLCLIVIIFSAYGKLRTNFGKRVYDRMTKDYQNGVPAQDVEYTLITTYDLTLTEARECIRNYVNGVNWFIERFKDR